MALIAGSVAGCSDPNGMMTNCGAKLFELAKLVAELAWDLVSPNTLPSLMLSSEYRSTLLVWHSSRHMGQSTKGKPSLSLCALQLLMQFVWKWWWQLETETESEFWYSSKHTTHVQLSGDVIVAAATAAAALALLIS